MKQVIVECLRGEVVLARYEFGEAISLTGPIQVEDRELIDQAKSALTTAGLAGPPYTGIKFRVRR